MADQNDPWALPNDKGIAKPPPPLAGSTGSTASTPASSAMTPTSQGRVAPSGATTPLPPPPPGAYGNAYPKNWMGIVALIAPFAGCIIPGGNIAGIVFGHLALGAVARGEANNRGLALAGLIVSYVFTGFWALYLLFVFTGGLFSGFSDY